MKIEYGRFSGAVLPGNPVFDKIAALCLLIYHVTGQLEWPSNFRLEYWRKNEEPGAAIKQRWAEEKLYPIDLGINKYHERNLGSACEVLAVDLCVDRNSVFGWLVNIANENNKTGYLKGAAGKMNMPYILKEAYKSQMFTSSEVAVEAAAHVIFAELQFRILHHQKLPRNAEEISGFPRIAELLRKVVFGKEEFSFSRYLYVMFARGDDEEEIVRRVEWWLACHRRAEQLLLVAKEKARNMPKEEFLVCGYVCISIRTDDDRLARAFFSSQNPPAMILCERRNGTFQILTSRRFHRRENVALQNSMRELHKKLMGSEVNGAKWFLDERIWAIMNGSRSLSDSTASGWNACRIKRLISETAQLPMKTVSREA